MTIHHSTEIKTITYFLNTHLPVSLFLLNRDKGAVTVSASLLLTSLFLFSYLFSVFTVGWVLCFYDYKNTAEKLLILRMNDKNLFIPFVLSPFSTVSNTMMCCTLYQLDFLQSSMVMSDQYSVFANREHRWANARGTASMISCGGGQYQYVHNISFCCHYLLSSFCLPWTRSWQKLPWQQIFCQFQ